MREIILWTGSVFLFALFLISLPMCTDDDENEIITKYGSVTGFVTDLQDDPLSQVKVAFNGDMDISDQDGKFVLEQVPEGNQVVISFSKPGFVKNFKTVEVEEDKTTLTHAALSAIDVESQVDPAQENEIQFNGAKVVLPANAIVDANGNAVSGQVTVNATYFDPTGDTYTDLFPGDFVGIQTNGTETPIESFGLIQVELSQGGQFLDLKSGELAQVEIPVPPELMGRAPATIPLWFFDEETGQWMEEGSANMLNGVYAGAVGHFSYWNADAAYADINMEIHGRTVDQNGDPLPYCAVDVWGVDYIGADYVPSGPDGYFTAKARADSKIKVEAVYSAEFFYRSDIYEFDTDPPGSFQHIGDIVISTEIATISFEEQNSGINYSLVEVFFLDQNKGWAVGEAGTVIHTSDGGQTWQRQETYRANFYRGVHFVNENTGWIVGGVGTILKTENGGATWDLQEWGNYQGLEDVQFINDQVGWIMGYTNDGRSIISKTTDRGLTWTPGNIPDPQGKTVKNFVFVDANIGWAVGWDGLVMKTTNGGANWEVVDANTDIDLRSVTIAGDNIWAAGWTFDWEIIIHSDDSGLTWEVQSEKNFHGLNAICAFDKNVVWAAGMWGSIADTEDGGENWRPVPGTGNITSTFYDMCIIGGTTGWAVGQDGMILKLTR